MSNQTYIINNQQITLVDIQEILKENKRVVLGDQAKQAIVNCRKYLDHKVDATDELIYGVNTGFGSLCNTAISKSDLAQLQLNLVRSHACGTGDLVQQDVVKLMLLLKAIGLSFGHSGAQLETVERLLFFYNNDILPVVYQQGSLGASGDLAPLAHIALALVGEGEVYYNNQRIATKSVIQDCGLQPIALKSKEGLALLNGTQFMSSHLLYAVLKAKALCHSLSKISALSIEAFDGRKEPFSANVNEIRNQIGQIQIAEEIRGVLDGSKLILQEKEYVQDPYCLRCIPQVHGASLDTISFAENIVLREINAVTDNPTIFPEEDKVISAGNFHGQPLALALDYMAIALAELGSISERRIYKLVSGTRGLPPFLVVNSGLNSGFMIVQYTAASIVSQNKQLCTPSSIDTIDSSNGQEDHVSMGANAATKLLRVLENCYQIAGLELMTAAQGLAFRKSDQTSPVLHELYTNFRKSVPFVENDIYMSPLMLSSKEFVKQMVG